MKILGNRILVSKVEDEVKDGGFQTVEVQDNFVNKGKVEQVPDYTNIDWIKAGDVILFAKYSPDTQEIEHEGKKMKIVRIEDVLAVL